jgi:hypothetical protein
VFRLHVSLASAVGTAGGDSGHDVESHDAKEDKMLVLESGLSPEGHGLELKYGEHVCRCLASGLVYPEKGEEAPEKTGRENGDNNASNEEDSDDLEPHDGAGMGAVLSWEEETVVEQENASTNTDVVSPGSSPVDAVGFPRSRSLSPGGRDISGSAGSGSSMAAVEKRTSIGSGLPSPQFWQQSLRDLKGLREGLTGQLQTTFSSSASTSRILAAICPRTVLPDSGPQSQGQNGGECNVVLGTALVDFRYRVVSHEPADPDVFEHVPLSHVLTLSSPSFRKRELTLGFASAGARDVFFRVRCVAGAFFVPLFIPRPPHVLFALSLGLILTIVFFFVGVWLNS